MVTLIIRIQLAIFIFFFWAVGLGYYGQSRTGIAIGSVAAFLLLLITKPKKRIHDTEAMQTPNLRAFVQTIKISDEENVQPETNTNKKEAGQNKAG